jgi:hypothetical protein
MGLNPGRPPHAPHQTEQALGSILPAQTIQTSIRRWTPTQDASPPGDSGRDHRLLRRTARPTALPRQNVLPVGPRQECARFVGTGLESMQSPRSILPLLPLQDHLNAPIPSKIRPMSRRPPQIHPVSIHLPSTKPRRNPIHHPPFLLLASHPGQIRFCADRGWVS